MNDARTLLIELGTEELPPKALDDLAAAFTQAVVEGLRKAGVDAAFDDARAYASPRRLAVLVPQVAAEQSAQTIDKRGPALTAGRDATGAPTKALIGFAQSCGVSVDALESLVTDKGSWFVYRAEKPGQPITAIVPGIVEEALRSLPIPKPMRWGDHDHAFVRPVHWLVLLHGADIIEATMLGVAAGRHSRGHRYHHAGPVHIVDADSWLDSLRSAHVVADPHERRERIRAEVARVAATLDGIPRLTPALLDEIANLTEWPVAIACTFDRAFLEVPQEALVMTMETNQKFIPLFDHGGRLTEHFIGVANIDSRDPAEIRKGYERVIRPRFADAKFFYDEDRKQVLSANQDALKSVTYQQSLGSVWDKSVRVAELARVIANRVGVDAALATRAAALGKCDLMSRMVGEFPELQGVMGRYYASQGNTPEAADVARALDEFYRPRFAGDAIAIGGVARVLAVAERIDTLAGIFAVGQKPSGNKDPFALRRTALGLARTLIEAELALDLRAQFEEALAQLPEAALRVGLPKGKDGQAVAFEPGRRRAELVEDLYAFVVDRLRGYYADQGVAGDVFESVRALSPPSLLDFDRRLRAVARFAELPDAQALAAANKRIGNILRQAGGEVRGEIDASLLASDAERALVEAVRVAEAELAATMATGDYLGSLQRLAALRAPVDRFFDEVMVNVEDPAVRANRLALLQRLHAMFVSVADIALLPASSQ